MNTALPFPSLHQEYLLWMNELRFAVQELRIFDTYLGRVPNEAAGALRKQFSRHATAIDRLQLRLHGAELERARFAREMSGMGLYSVRMEDNAPLREAMLRFRDRHNEMKTTFRRFEAKK
ncbi:hypothetical protein [Flaviaesturariibacter amylovorans]|uniref:Uncharacterized protein n=1 Tax=Flaviaesturariibacter amylovorans TaxID=1084520 RepID=A0ABP8GUD0_9BACT